MLTIQSGIKVENHLERHMLLFSSIWLVILFAQPVYSSFILVAYSITCFWLFYRFATKRYVTMLKIQGKHLVVRFENGINKKDEQLNLNDLKGKLIRVREKIGGCRYDLVIIQNGKIVCCISRRNGFEEYKIIALSNLLRPS